MSTPIRVATATAAAIAITAGVASAQQPPAATQPAAPQVGQAAPDFQIRAATRYGVIKDPVQLADFRGRVVVLAFFPRARTAG